MSGFSARLREARQQHGWTQEQLAYELNVTKASISAWENGREAPRFALLPRLRLVLGVSLDTLICEEGGDLDLQVQAHTVRARDEEEIALLKAYRALPLKRRQALLDMLG